MIVFKSIFIFSVIFVFFVGPWPVDDTHFSLTKYAHHTFENINRIKVDSKLSSLSAGAAKVEIIPMPNSPLAGYAARDSKENTGTLDKVFAKAITIENSNTSITLLSAEILLPLKELVDAIVLKTKLKRNQIYFMATHTHSGPGGYAHGIVEEASIGEFSQEQFNMLVNTLSDAVLKSRANLLPVKIKYSRLSLSSKGSNRFIHNQLFENATSHNSIHTLEIVNTITNIRLATLITFSAHPTFLGRINHKISGDYPSILTNNLENTLGGIVVFSAGAVGSMLPSSIDKEKTKGLDGQIRQRDNMGKDLAVVITNALSNMPIQDDNSLVKKTTWQAEKTSIQSEIIPVNLPWPNYRISDNLRLSPYLIRMLFHDNTTYIQTLKIGKLMLLSFPADYSGELALDLENWGDKVGVFPWVMSFNGEYIGYITPSKRYELDHYVTRDVNFYGRWTGDYFHEISKKIIHQLQ